MYRSPAGDYWYDGDLRDLHYQQSAGPAKCQPGPPAYPYPYYPSAPPPVPAPPPPRARAAPCYPPPPPPRLATYKDWRQGYGYVLIPGAPWDEYAAPGPEDVAAWAQQVQQVQQLQQRQQPRPRLPVEELHVVQPLVARSRRPVVRLPPRLPSLREHVTERPRTAPAASSKAAHVDWRAGDQDEEEVDEEVEAEESEPDEDPALAERAEQPGDLGGGGPERRTGTTGARPHPQAALGRGERSPIFAPVPVPVPAPVPVTCTPAARLLPGPTPASPDTAPPPASVCCFMPRPRVPTPLRRPASQPAPPALTVAPEPRHARSTRPRPEGPPRRDAPTSSSEGPRAAPAAPAAAAATSPTWSTSTPPPPPLHANGAPRATTQQRGGAAAAAARAPVKAAAGSRTPSRASSATRPAERCASGGVSATARRLVSSTLVEAASAAAAATTAAASTAAPSSAPIPVSTTTAAPSTTLREIYNKTPSLASQQSVRLPRSRSSTTSSPWLPPSSAPVAASAKTQAPAATLGPPGPRALEPPAQAAAGRYSSAASAASLRQIFQKAMTPLWAGSQTGSLEEVAGAPRGDGVCRRCSTASDCWQPRNDSAAAVSLAAIADKQGPAAPPPAGRAPSFAQLQQQRAQHLSLIQSEVQQLERIERMLEG